MGCVAPTKLGARVHLGVAVAKAARHGDCVVAVKRPDRAVRDGEDRGMHEGGMIAVALVLQDEFPVRPSPVAQKSSGEIELACR